MNRPLLILTLSLLTTAAQAQVRTAAFFTRSANLLSITGLRQESGLFFIDEQHRNRHLTATYLQDAGGTVEALFHRSGSDSVFSLTINPARTQARYRRAANREDLRAGRFAEVNPFGADSAYYVHTGPAMPDAAWFFELTDLLAHPEFMPLATPNPQPDVPHRIRWLGPNLSQSYERMVALQQRYCPGENTVQYLSTTQHQGFMDVTCP